MARNRTLASAMWVVVELSLFFKVDVVIGQSSLFDRKRNDNTRQENRANVIYAIYAKFSKQISIRFYEFETRGKLMKSFLNKT